MTAFNCMACEDSGWVCKSHPARPWEGSDTPSACTCGGGGMPCEWCNTEYPPRQPHTRITVDDDAQRKTADDQLPPLLKHLPDIILIVVAIVTLIVVCAWPYL